MGLSVVIPVYNEASTIETVIDRVRAVPIEKELIIVDDGSTDGTLEKLDAVERLDDVRVVRHERTRGKVPRCVTGLVLPLRTSWSFRMPIWSTTHRTIID